MHIERYSELVHSERSSIVRCGTERGSATCAGVTQAEVAIRIRSRNRMACRVLHTTQAARKSRAHRSVMWYRTGKLSTYLPEIWRELPIATGTAVPGWTSWRSAVIVRADAPPSSMRTESEPAAVSR